MASAKWVRPVIGGVVVVVVVAGVGFGAYSLFQHHRQREYLGTANAAFEQGEWREAKKYYEYYLTKHPDDVNVLLQYGEVGLRRLDNREAALRQAAQAFILIARLQPDNVEIQDKVLEIQERAHAYSDLEYYADLFLRKRPDDSRLLNLRAMALDRAARRDEAIDAYRELIDKGIAEPQVYADLAILLTERRLDDQAKGVLAKALEQHPENGAVRAQRARFYLHARRVEDASQEIVEALKLAPDDPTVLLVAMRVAITQKDWDAAAQYGARLIAEYPGEEDAPGLLARVYAQQGHGDKAVELLNGLDPYVNADNPENMVILFDVHLAAGRIGEAREVSEVFAKTHPNNSAIQDYLKARLALADNNVKEAITLLDSVVVRMPTFGPAHIHLGVAYLQAGQSEQARQSLESYLRSNPDDPMARALLDRILSPPKSLEDLLAGAKTLRDSDAATPTLLVAAAMQTYEAAKRLGRVSECLTEIRDLLESAIRRDPKIAQAYRALCQVFVDMKDFEAAHRILEEAAAAGLPEKDILWPRAAVALAQENGAEARSLCEKDLARPDVTAEEIVRWGGLFASRGQTEAALEILAREMARRQGEDKRVLALERVLMTARLKDPEQAVELVKELEASGIGGLNEGKLVIAQEMVRRNLPDFAAKAKALVQAVRQSDPASLQAQALDAQLMLLQTPPDFDGARKEFTSVLATDAANESALLGMAHAAMLQRDFQGAVDWSRKALSASPRSIRAVVQQADALMSLRQYEEAERLLKQALTADPENPLVMEMMINAYLEMNRPEDAQSVFEKLKTANPSGSRNDTAVQHIEARLLAARGTPEEAEKAIRARLAADPGNLVLMRDLALTLEQLGKKKEAEEMLVDYAEAHKEKPEAWATLAQFYARRNTPEYLGKASSALTRALLASPNDAQALREMVDLQMRRGDTVSANTLCDRYLALHPDDPVMLFRKASLLGQRNEELPRALSLIERALQLDAKPEYGVLRGLLRVASRDYAQGIQDLEPAARDGKASGLVDAALAEAYAATGDARTARKWLDSATEKSQNGDSVSVARLNAVRNMLGK